VRSPVASPDVSERDSTTVRERSAVTETVEAYSEPRGCL